MIKRRLFGSLLFIVLFIGAALSFNYIENRKRDTRPVEGFNPTMGCAYILYDGQIINTMMGYTSSLRTDLYRDSIVPLDSTKEIKVILPEDADTGADITYELRSFDGTNLIEEGDFRFVTTSDNLTEYTTTLRMDLTLGKEYSFRIKAKQGDESKCFYTRVVRLDKSRLSDFVAFAGSFSDGAFEGNAAANLTASTTDAVTTYNVSGDEADIKNQEKNFAQEKEVATSTDAMSGVKIADISSVFGSADAMSDMYTASTASEVSSDGNPGYVTLKSSYEDVTYNGLKIERLSEPIPKIKELTEESAVVEFRYKAISERENGADTFAIYEYFSLEYDNGSASIKVNDYRRFMNQDFTARGFDSINNGICLGLTADRNPQYVSSEDSKQIAFVADNSVWVYNNSDKTYSSVFGTSSDEAQKERIPQEGYGLNLLEIKDGILYFVVYGRINEGPREGQVGVGLYEYSIENVTLRELCFVFSDFSFDTMLLSTKKFSYYDRVNRHFYTMIGDSIIDVDIITGEKDVIVSDIPSNQIAVSENGKVVAFPDNKDLVSVNKITIMDFEKGTKVEKKDGSMKLALMGFVGDNILYGAARQEDIYFDIDDTPAFYFSKLFIVGPDGSDIKVYEKEGTYVSGISFKDNTIYLDRVTKNDDTGEVTKTDPDYISYKMKDNDNKLEVAVKENADYNQQLYILLPDNVIMSQNNEELFTKVSLNTNNVEISATDAALEKMPAYIYDASGIRGTAYSAGKAITEIYDDGGYVVDGDGGVLYMKKQSKPYLTVAGTFEYKSADTGEESFAACNYMCMLAAGLDADYDTVRSRNNWILNFDEAGAEVKGVNISGVKLETAIGYLSDGSPFAAKFSDRYVLVVSYNDDFIRYYDPIEDKEVRLMRYQFQLKVNDEGNEFYTYVKE